MAHQYTEEELLLAISDAVKNNERLTCEELKDQLFGKNASSISSQLTLHIQKEITKKHKFICRFLLKNHLLGKLKAGSSEFIKKFIDLRKKHQIIEAFNDEKKLYRRLMLLQNQKSLGSLLVECNRAFDRLREKFASSENEAKMRKWLVDWFRSSFMTLDSFEKFCEWNRNNPNLKVFKNLLTSMNENNAKSLLKMANTIKTDNFMEPQKLKGILDVFCINPTVEIEDEILKVKGHLIYLSQMKLKIENYEKKRVKHVCIFAEDACIIDCDLNTNFWSGMNFTIISNKIFVKGAHKIMLSGSGHNPGNKKAANSYDSQYNGTIGDDGSPGESSGNIALLTKDFINPSNLSIELNGGRGKDGDDGGDGCNGRDGAGVTEQEIENFHFYSSLYRDSWSSFDNYSPPNIWTKTEGNSSSGNYILRKYKDQNGRKMTYSFAGDKGWTYTTYEIYFIIEGSDGTSGSSGGSNGIGGEGGYRGTATIQNPETGESFNVNIIQNAGQSGENGKVGKSGKFGINGNDLALIDRSANETSKHIKGDSNHKLSWSNVYEAEYYSRLNGYIRYEQNRKACFIKFGVGEKIDTSERRSQKATERITRTRNSKATAKSSIFIDEIINEAVEIFGQENSFLADACDDATEKAKDEAEDEEEEEAQENVSEEVVILRQREDTPKLSKYTPDNEKMKRPTYTSQEFINYVKSLGRRTSYGKNAQYMFDLFTIELNPDEMNSIVLSSLFHQSHFRQAIQSPFTIALIGALQSRLINGKSFEEIKLFTQDFEWRRIKKIATTNFRKECTNFISNFNAAKTKVEIFIKDGNKTHFGIKPCNLSEILEKYNDPNEIEKMTEDFFGNYVDCKVNDELMAEMNLFLLQIEKNDAFLGFLNHFVKKDLQWTDRKEVEEYMTQLSAWHIEEQKRKKDDDKEKNEKMRSQNDREQKFQQFLECIVKEHEIWNESLKPIVKVISSNKEYITRFGDPIKLDEEGYKASAKAKLTMLKNLITSKPITDKDIDLANYVIRMYFLSKEILTFQKDLYNYNLVMHKEKIRQHAPFKLVENFGELIVAKKQNPLPTETAECQEYMQKYTLSCSTFRHLLSQTLNIRICTYKQKGFQTLELMEDLNARSEHVEMIWLHDDKTVNGIAADNGFRDLIAAQQNLLHKHRVSLNSELTSYKNNDFKNHDDIHQFAEFYPAPLQNSVIEWLNNYWALTKDVKLLKLLFNRFYIDGCHITVFELQFILLSSSRLMNIYHCQIDYLLLLLSSVSQKEFIDVIGYTRIQYHQSCRFKTTSKIFSGFRLIPSSRYKALFVVKLESHNSEICEDDLYKVILMLQHASNGSEQLFKIDMNEWIEIAKKQKWNEINSLLKEYGSIGYYLGVLDNYGLYEEERSMQKIFNDALIIPEKFIAWFTNMIVNEGDKESEDFEFLKKVLQKGNDYPGLIDKQVKHQLITDEINQAKLMHWILNKKITNEPFSMATFSTPNDRNVEDLIKKIIGLKDDSQQKEIRKKELQKIGELLTSNNIKNNNMKYLNKFDEKLFKLHKKRLRDTQKMAILCTVESGKNVLEQVNTGEGKSFIIAAIACIRCKTGHRFVDVITSSSVLAQRDSKSMKSLYKAMGLTVADNCSEDIEERNKAYSADIVYGDIARFQRDYLLHTFYKKPILGDRVRDAVIVDEVDNMILDNSNNMLYLSHSVPGMNLFDSLLIFIQQQVFSPIYSGDKNNIDEMQAKFDNSAIKNKILSDLFGHFSIADLSAICHGLLHQRIQDIYEKLINGHIVDKDGYLIIYRYDQINDISKALNAISNDIVIKIQTCFRIILCRERIIKLPAYLRPFAKLHLDTLIENCKNAYFLEANTGYVIDVDHTGKIQSSLEQVVTIIDQNTGADLASSQWTGGLHQFLQLKHGCGLSPMSLKAVFMSNISFLKDYKRMNGLSGTLGSEEESQTLIDIYGVDLIKIPTNKPKIFYEHVPVIATEENDWTKNIYDEICDQVIVQRSVLVICEDIRQLNQVLSGISTIYNKEENPHKFVKNCFQNMVVYKREHDEFNFEDDNKKFQTSQLIIATNLAGRGTDIKLSDELANNGGLHVITAFMPKNRRIEEQAFGRAARSGQPGSAQIIALSEPTEISIKPSIFQLKTYRDNAEVHRLQSLKSFYDFHTDIEEKCLEKFRKYCEKVLASAYSSSTSSSKNGETLPSINQVIYFTLLDLWALWLDEKSPEISQCSKEGGTKEVKEKRKNEIIDSVDKFLHDHPFDSFDSAKKWLRNPQALIIIGIIQMCHNNGFADAEESFDKVLAEGHEFAAEVEYYKGCMRMNKFESMRKSSNDLKISNPTNFKADIPSALEHFIKSRALFKNRILQKQKEASVIVKLIEKFPENNPKTSGFANQIKTATKNIELILSNIDYLLGEPCHEKMFVNENINERYSKLIYDVMCRQGIIGPELLCEHEKMDEWQLEPFRNKYKWQRKQINSLVDSIISSPQSQSFDNDIVFNKWLIYEKAELSNRANFWQEMEQQKAFYNTEMFIAIHNDKKVSKEIHDLLNQLNPFVIPKEELRYKVRYSGEKELGILYKTKAVNALIGDNENLSKNLQHEISEGNIKLEKLADILITNESMEFFSEFDGIILEDFMKFFNLDFIGAKWILNSLRDKGCLELQQIQMTRCTLNETKWNELVRIHLPENAPEPSNNEEMGKKLLFKHSGILQQIKNNSKLLNISVGVIEHLCNLSKEDAQKFYDYLINQEILEPYLYEIWRINSKLDCSHLPSCISSKIDEFLADRFAYSFALEDLCSSIEATHDRLNCEPHQIFLPENPFADLFDDFIDAGLGIPKRITSKNDDLDYFDYDDFKHSDFIKEVIYSNRPKLQDQTYYHFEITSFASYVLKQNIQIDSDIRALIDNGLKIIVAKKEEKVGSWITNKIISMASTCWNKIKSAANACCNFGYSVVKFCCQLPGKIYGAVSSVVGPYVKQAGDFIIKLAKPLINSSIGKVVIGATKEILSEVKETIIDIGYLALDAAEATIKYTKKAGKYVYNKAAELGNEIAQSKLGQAIKNGISDGINAIKTSEIWKMAAETATFLYSKMSEYCTAISESYKYYNQCRTMARRLVNENRLMVDEHSILITFHGINKEETKKDNNKNEIIKKIQKHIEDHRPHIQSAIQPLIETKLKSHPKIESAMVEKLLSKGHSIKTFKTELDNLLKFGAWQKQTEYYKILINSEGEEDDDVDLGNVTFMEHVSSRFYFLEDSIDAIFEEIEKLREDEGYDSDNTEIEKTSKDISNLKDLLMDFTKVAINQSFIQPTTSLILSFYESLKDKQLPPSASDAYFNHEDKSLKQALTDYNETNKSKQKAVFLFKELIQTIHACLEIQPINTNLLKTAIKYGYPLPISVAPKITETINNCLMKMNIYKSGVLLEILHGDKKIISRKYGDGKAKLILHPKNGRLFICQSDYLSYAGIHDAVMDDVNSEKAYFHESLTSYLKILRQHFPKQGESLREILLQNL